MKKIVSAIIATMLLAVPAVALSKKGKETKANTLEVSFNYQRQNGPGSNQYAVWIENEKGDVVKTLFVTSFTTKGRTSGNLYSGSFSTKDKKGNISLTSQLTEPDEQHKDMVTDVKATLK